MFKGASSGLEEAREVAELVVELPGLLLLLLLLFLHPCPSALDSDTLLLVPS